MKAAHPSIVVAPHQAGARPLSRLLGAGAALLAACGSPAAAPQVAPAPVEVGVVTLAAEPVPLQRELPGRTSPYRVAEVRARVNGIVLERLFEEGSDVREGQVLFRIDPQPYEATLESARATLARAEATLESNRLLSERYAELLAGNAVSRQEHDNAHAAHRASVADVAAGRAAVKSAALNVGYTRVASPIAGRVGRAAVTEGAYVQQGQATLMATVQQLDPIYVDLTQSSAELLRLQRRFEEGKLQRPGEGPQVRLVLEDGSLYPEVGTLQFSDVTVDPGTGSVALRALFPNPKRQLLPGMFVRAQLEEGVVPDGILVPQPAVRRDAQGKASVLLVGEGGTAEVRQVVAERAIGDRWLVTEGLAPGEQVIVEGLQKIRSGSPVAAVPATSPAAASKAAR